MGETLYKKFNITIQLELDYAVPVEIALSLASAYEKMLRYQNTSKQKIVNVEPVPENQEVENAKD